MACASAGGRRVRAAKSSGSATYRTHKHANVDAWLAKHEPQLRAPTQLAWLERLDAENDNLRAALEWATEDGDVELGLRAAAGLWRFWQTRSLNGEGRERLERLLALDVRDVDPIIVANGIAAAGLRAYMVGDYNTAGRLVAREPGRAPARRNGAVGGDDGGDPRVDRARTWSVDEAAPLIEEAVELARASRDWWVQSVNLSALGELHRARDEPGKARLALEESLRAARECGDLRNIGRILSVLGLVELGQGDHDRARRLFEEALDVQRSCRDAVPWRTIRRPRTQPVGRGGDPRAPSDRSRDGQTETTN